ncbi:DUF308 domain-containing protein [Streptomyces sp. MI02-7b]|uniref:DUF308 domain-containing protein n=1 Tax=Streptomyces sp. MI02-7b TaxID=462941 RepID=UPI0029BC7E0D|nr:DUF308 domain-containing protein [Streptomyces sp. MI02-7b]MDX3074147.1 hypothetical protein [Streptomyces sp. MI02-7b]
MTQTTATSTASTTSTPGATTPSGLRSLHLIRVVFSLIWVALVLTTSGSLVSADSPTGIAAVLLVVYPLWDAAATLLERRLAGTGSADRVSTVNLGLGLATTAVMIIAVFSTIGAALVVFGVWALLSGAIQLVVAIRRRRTVGAQWPMVISGGQSVLAGATIAATSASATSSLSTVAGYSAFGAFWFLVSVIALGIRSRRGKR